MKKRILSLLVLLMTAVTGAWAETITWDDTNVFKRENQGVFITQDNMQGSAVTSTSASATYEGITISCDKSDGSHLMLCASYGAPAGRLTLRGASGDSFTFTAPTGKIFTKIEIDGYVGEFTPYGDWTKPSDMQIAWSGTAANTVTLGSVNTSMPQVGRIVFYVEEPLPGYTVTLKEGTEDATKWQGKAGTGDYQALPLEGVAAGTAVTVKYFGTKKVESVKAVKAAPAVTWNTVDLSTLTADYEAQDGDKLTGTLSGNKKISIADGATVMLDGAVINGTNSSNWAGLTLAGDGTIILSGENSVKGFYEDYPGIFVPANKTLTIQGDGSLTASSNGFGAGIGGGYEKIACGNITIEGGTINAQGGTDAAGIGGGWSASCGNISITGGTVTATGGKFAAGIGSGSSGSKCGNITITDGVTNVTATKGVNAPNSIGAGWNGSCGTVTIGGNVTGNISTSPYTYQP